MKQLFIFAVLCLTLCACEVRHDHKKQMMQVRVPVDTTQKKDVQPIDDSWKDEPLVETVDEFEEDVRVDLSDEEALDELDRLMTGKPLE